MAAVTFGGASLVVGSPVAYDTRLPLAPFAGERSARDRWLVGSAPDLGPVIVGDVAGVQ